MGTTTDDQSRQQQGARRQDFTIRMASIADVPSVADVIYDAFEHINTTMNLPPEFPPREMVDLPAIIAAEKIRHPRITSVVAVDQSGRIIGSSSVDLRDEVAAIGPVVVAKDWWSEGVGRQLMKTVLEHAQDKKCVVLTQVTANTRSFCLYASLGFAPVETCLDFEGRVRGDVPMPKGYTVRQLTHADIGQMDLIHADVFRGRSRLWEITEFVERSALEETKVKCYGATRVERDPTTGKSYEVLASYTTGFAIDGHGLAEDAEALKALLIGVSHMTRDLPNVPPPTLHLQARLNPELVPWLLDSGLHLRRQIALMAIGDYMPPAPGIVYLPSIHY